jgi:hypothetical protein
MPGVPAAGHVTARGYWHPGRPEGCVKCEVPLPCAECGRPLRFAEARLMWQRGGTFRLCKDTRGCERRVARANGTLR